MKILMVSTPSLHFFRWTDQLQDSGHEVYWFDITGMSDPVERISWVSQKTGWKLKWNYPGRFFFKNNWPKAYRFFQVFNEHATEKVFEEYLKKVNPDVVHSFAMQLSCIPIYEIMNKNRNLKWIYSSWGSDMFHSEAMGINNHKFKTVLKRIDYLITDCKRDFNIAIEKGFKGNFFGVFPGNGGVQYDEATILPVIQRKTILIKGYNDSIGKGLNSVKAISYNILPLIKDFTIVVFGADDKIVSYIKKEKIFNELKIKVYKKIDFLKNTELLQLMGESYIYIGNSISDGLPNALIEAAGMGAFPIQSNPGNVTTELINDGYNGLLIKNPMDISEIESLIKRALLDTDMINTAFEYNTNMIKGKYGRKHNKGEIIKLYDSIS